MVTGSRRYTPIGPIAETYFELQALDSLRRAHDSVKGVIDKEESLKRTLTQALELIYMNLQLLCERQRAAFLDKPQAKLNKILLHSLWHVNILNIALQISSTLATLSRNPSASGMVYHLPSPDSALSDYITEHDNLCEAFLTIVESRRADFEIIISSHSFHDPLSNVVHCFKNIEMLNHSIVLSLKNVSIDRSGSESYAQFIGSADLKKAVTFPDVTGDNYFVQFRLLHQVPELLAMSIIEKAGYISELMSNNVSSIHKESNVLFELKMINSMYKLIVVALEPLIHLLPPSEYHEIRANLGQTSGSDSSALQRNILTTTYQEITQAVSRLVAEDRADDHMQRLLSLELRELSRTVFLWRERHLCLPRNVLGGFGAKSLIGNPDAVQSAQAFHKTFAGRMNTESERTAVKVLCSWEDVNSIGPRLGLPWTKRENAEKLDAALLQITSDSTKRRFSDVQQRTGYFAPEFRRKKDD